MAKNKGKDLGKRLFDEVEMQRRRLKDLISIFYPDGTRAEFNKASQVAKNMAGHPMFTRYSEDESIQAKLLKVSESVKEEESGSTEIDFKYNTQKFQGRSAIVHNVFIMFKVATEKAPIYLHDKDEFIEGGFTPRFIIDAEAREAFILLEDMDFICKRSDSNNSSFASLSEFHAIFCGYYDDAKSHSPDTEIVCYMTSFSKTNGSCHIEKIFDLNLGLLDGLIADSSSEGDKTQK